MDATTAAVFAQKAAFLNVFYTVFALFVIVGAFTFLAAFGEKTLGLNLRGIVDAIEANAHAGDTWPAVIAFFVVPAGLLALILYIGLR